MKNIEANMLQVRIAPRVTGTNKDFEEILQDHLYFAESCYKEAFNRGVKIGEHAIVPNIFMIGTEKKTLMIFDIEKVAPSKQIAVMAVRGVMKQVSERDKETPEWFVHMSECNITVQEAGTPQEKYTQQTGNIFPGSKRETRYMVNQEWPDRYASTAYHIDPVTGKFTVDDDTGLSNNTQVVEEVSGPQAPSYYQGIFTHFVYKPEEAVPINPLEAGGAIVLPPDHPITKAVKAREEAKEKQEGKEGE